MLKARTSNASPWWKIRGLQEKVESEVPTNHIYAMSISNSSHGGIDLYPQQLNIRSQATMHFLSILQVGVSKCPPYGENNFKRTTVVIQILLSLRFLFVKKEKSAIYTSTYKFLKRTFS